ncbi:MULTISPECIES: LAETG motif-containing sortase-dependent surface protein [unclassified Streptomyces]|uniref:LAETG motif-containing sortase-dependent surface protein n=1 Tax=unclassified Streptomyces TaxID=2593676 RepID=UPI004042C347
MSITHRGARRSVRILGVASASAAIVLGVSGSALACQIGDFKAEAGCAGDKGQIVITDTDGSGTKAHITVFEKNDAVETKVAEADVQGSAQGTKTPIDVDWKAKTTYSIEVKVDSGRFHFDQRINPDLTTPAEACKKEESPTPTAPSKPTPKPSKSAPAESATPTPSASASSSAPASAPSNAPSPAAGDSNLAETGANSNTGLIAGIAGALVVVGGGAVYFGMRRRGARGNG